MVQTMANGDAADKEDVDLVTDIQRKLGNLLGLMYSCTGAIQVTCYISLRVVVVHSSIVKDKLMARPDDDSTL